MVAEVLDATSPAQVAAARGLIQMYARSLGFSLDFQAFDQEIAGLPGAYAPPGGFLLLAMDGDRAVGCVAVRPIEGKVCEMKRLYTLPEVRGRGVGRALAMAAVERARTLGYERMRLDTVRRMTEANALYESLGFRPIPPYRHNPLEDASFFELEL